MNCIAQGNIAEEMKSEIKLNETFLFAFDMVKLKHTDYRKLIFIFPKFSS